MNRILSGIRATGRLHFGSFVGAVQHFVRYQNEPETTCLYFIADYHTLTTLDDPEGLRVNLIEIVKDYLAAGLDPEKSVLYAQSSVPRLAELSLLLSMLQPRGELDGLATLKDLKRGGDGGFTLGMMTYPVLMAADILGPHANMVPVGEDQKPNVELARNLAIRFNNRFGQTFTLPETMDEMIKVPGLDGNKMGKSDAKNTIGLSMSKEEILERYLKRGITDPERTSISVPGDPENRCRSVFPVHKLVTSADEVKVIEQRCQDAELGCRDCKVMMVENLFPKIASFQERRPEFADKDDLIREILHEGGKKARSIINPTVEEVADKMGLSRFVQD